MHHQFFQNPLPQALLLSRAKLHFLPVIIGKTFKQFHLQMGLYVPSLKLWAAPVWKELTGQPGVGAHLQSCAFGEFRYLREGHGE